MRALSVRVRGGGVWRPPPLLDAGADEQLITVLGKAPEDMATEQGHHQVAAMLKAEGVRRAQCVAFAMGHHARLGEGTWVEELDADVVRMVLEKVAPTL